MSKRPVGEGAASLDSNRSAIHLARAWPMRGGAQWIPPVRAPGSPVALSGQSSLPQDGPGHAIHALAELLRASLRADICLIVVTDPRFSESRLYRATGLDAQASGGAAKTSLNHAPSVLEPLEGPVLFSRPRSRSRAGSSRTGYAATALGGAEARERLTELADLLGADSFMSLPLGSGEHSIGRVYVGSRLQRYTSRDLVPLWHGVKQACVLIESLKLVDRLAIEVASQERRRISRDLHDSAIQPYIGLKLGLEALRRRHRGVDDLASEVDELIRIAGDGIGELRQYVGSLKKAGTKKPADSLLPAVRSQAKKFADFYGIEARVIAEGDIPVTAPMQHEIIQIVREGLSNIRRHTSAERATINLREGEGRLLLELINDKAGRTNGGRNFFPRSIGERAKELGGRVSVQHRSGNRTVVAVELPL